MRRLLIAGCLWLAGAGLAVHVLVIVLTQLGSGRRFNAVVFGENWHISVPALLLSIGAWLADPENRW